MAETTSPEGGADTLAPTQPAPEQDAAPKQTIILAEATGDASIRPFSFRASDEELADLKRRIRATRWPGPETISDDSQGVQLATIQKLADHWADQHDWRKEPFVLPAISRRLAFFCDPFGNLIELAEVLP